MGNTISPCSQPCSKFTVKLILWEGTTRVLKGKKLLAGEIMFEFPDRIICHAESFFIGHPIPSLSIEDELMPGQIYFVIPLDCFPRNILTTSSLSLLGSNPKRTPINLQECPFEYIKGLDGKVSIKVSSGFLTNLITRDKESSVDSSGFEGSFLCSTPELRKQYEMLVGSREQVWSPKLETISEHKIRFSPCRGWNGKKKENKLLN